MKPSLSRRTFLGSLAAGGVAAGALGAAPSGLPVILGRRRAGPVAVASANGAAAVARAVQLMQQGRSPVEAAVEGVVLVEDDPLDDSVGLGGLPNADGVVELDACCMDGPRHLAGAVASLRNIKNPSRVALEVLRRTDHVLLVGEGALRFARMHGFEEQDLLTDASRRAWVEWREGLSETDDWVRPEDNELPKAPGGPGEGGHGGHDHDKHEQARAEAGTRARPAPRQTGTIHLSARDAAGSFGACTTTSGLAYKIPGRVGDSPLIGCGLWLDDDIGSAGSTGRGEAVILSNGSAQIVEQMRQGKSPTDACLELLKRIAHYTRIARLRDEQGRPSFQVKFYAIDKQGRVGAAGMYPGSYVVATGDGVESRDIAHLYER